MTDESDGGLEIRAADKGKSAETTVGLQSSVANAGFFQLPREIRDRIYQLCLTTQDGLPVEWPANWKPYKLQPQLLRTCWVVYKEAAPILYKANNITFHHPSDANMFVRAMTSTELSRQITMLGLHIKSQDTRLWVPYLKSRDPYRSLSADFQFLREINVRFRSNKWQHSLPPESNMRTWCEDSRLDDVINGLRSCFFPELGVDAFDAQQDWTSAEVNDDSNPTQRKVRRPRPRDVYTTLASRQAPTPTIKLVCACRINAAQFAHLTSDAALAPEPLNPAQVGATDGAALGTRALPTAPLFYSQDPVREGDPFRGFSAIDLRYNTKKLHDPDLGSATVARTPFADKNGVLISLEVHSLDPRRDNPETRNV